MTQPTKPSAREFSISDGPVYAGDPYFAVHDGGGRLVALLPCWDDGERPSYETQARTIVSILNRETGVGELLEAAKGCLDLAAVGADLGPQTPGAAKIAAGDVERLKQAIANCEQGE